MAYPEPIPGKVIAEELYNRGLLLGSENRCSYLVVFKRNTKNISKEEDRFGFGVVDLWSGNVAVDTTDLFDLPCRTLPQL